MITKYGYKINNPFGVCIMQTWGFDSYEAMIEDINKQYIAGNLTGGVQLFKTLHRNYFGKQFKQISCEQI